MEHAQRSFQSYRDIIRSGCPLIIPSENDQLIPSLTDVEQKTSGVSKEPYLSAQAAWLQSQHGSFPTLFIARCHTLHRNDASIKCPTMRVMRVVPRDYLKPRQDPRHILVNTEYPEWTRAIGDAEIEEVLLSDIDQNTWLPVNQLEKTVRKNKFTNPSQYSVTSTLLGATHYPYYSEKMLVI